MGRHRAVEVERLVVVEGAHFGKNPRDDVDDLGHGPAKVLNLPRERVALVGRVAALIVEERRGALVAVGRDPPREREVVARLVVRARLLKGVPAFEIDDPRGRMRPSRRRIAARREALRFDEQGPAGSRRRRALLSRPLAATSSASSELAKSGPRNATVVCRMASFCRTIPGATRHAPGRRSGNRWVGSRYSRRLNMIPFLL